MGLAVSRLEWEWYIPVWRGNRARALTGQDPSPMAVEIRYPTYGAILRRAERRAEPNGVPGAYQKAMFLEHTRGVRGLTVEGTSITTAAELWAEAVDRDGLDYDVILEILQAIDSRASLDAGLKKTWPAPFGLSSSSPPSDGTVAHADAKD